MSEAFQRLERFLQQQMRMSHIYQPLMLKVLLRSGGRVRTRDIAATFLAEDQSQLDYYENITRRMPGTVLRKRGIVVRDGDGYALANGLSDLSSEEIDALVARCDAAIETYKARRGEAIWQHRALGIGNIPGQLRYETLKRAGFRCELCGIPADERALDVDHIQPRKLGGADVAENLQALCWLCNTNKGAGDDADFRGVRDLHARREEGCAFCELPADRVIAENSLAVVIRDAYPVTPLHTLIIPKRHVGDYFELFSSEQRAIQALLTAAKRKLSEQDHTIAGVNVGINCGEAAGQTIKHAHVHLIPRRAGDVGDPRRGVRALISGKAAYGHPSR